MVKAHLDWIISRTRQQRINHSIQIRTNGLFQMKCIINLYMTITEKSDE